MKDRRKKKRSVRSLINLLLPPSRGFLMSIIEGNYFQGSRSPLYTFFICTPKYAIGIGSGDH